MKVFADTSGGAETDDILAALNDAVILGVDCINMSLGTSCGFNREADNDAINETYDAVEAAGISLITAASNDYSSGMGGPNGNTNKTSNPDSGTVGSPSSYTSTLSVASISGRKSPYLVANDSDTFFSYNQEQSLVRNMTLFKDLRMLILNLPQLELRHMNILLFLVLVQVRLIQVLMLKVKSQL